MRRGLLIIFTVLLLFAHILALAQASQTVDNGLQTQAAIFPGAGCVYNWTNNKPGIGLPSSGTGDIAAFTAINTGKTPVVATIKATPVLTTYAYIANQGSNKVTVIDGTTHAAIKTIDIGTTPVGVTASPDGKYVYTANNVTNDVSVISTVDNTLVTNIPVGTNPFGITISPDSKWVYVSNQNGGSISVINTQTNSVFTTISPVLSISSLCVSPDGKWVYAATETGTGAKVYVINALNNTIDSTIPIAPSGNDGMVITPDGKNLYFTNNQTNTLTVINLVTKAVSTIQVGSTDPSINTGPYGIAINSIGTRLYVVCGYTNEVDIINTANNTVIKRISTGAKQPFTVSVSSDDKEFYVTERSSNTVDVFSSSNYSKITTIADPSFADPFSSGNFISKGPGCSGSPVTFTITVNATPPQLTATAATGTISACVGSPSASPDIQQFTVSATGLTNDVTATAPANFEVSLSTGSGYAHSITIKQSAGLVNGTIVYVRSAASATMGPIPGKIVLASAGVASKNVAVDGVVNALPTVNTPGNQVYKNGDVTTAVSFIGTGNIFNWVNNTPAIGLAASGTGDIAPFTAVNTGAGTLTATVTVTPESGDFAYVANGDDNNVSVINTSTHALFTTIPVGQGPTYVTVSPDGKRVYVVNNSSNSISVINTGTNKVITEISVGSTNQIILSADNKFLYVTDYTAKTIRVINVGAFTEAAPIPLSEQPSGVAINTAGSKLYVANPLANTVSVVDIATKTIIATINVDSHPQGIIMSPDGSRVYVTNFFSNTISVINITTNNVDFTISQTHPNPDGVAISPDGSKLYVANFGDGSVSIINTAANAISATVATGANPSGIDVTADGAFIYVTNQGANNMSVISTATNSVTATIPTGSSPKSPGKFIVNGTGCTGVPVTFTIKVNAQAPVITTAPVTGTITACTGSPSVSPDIQQFTVSATGLTNDITATAPANFEMSLSAGSGYAHSITIKQSAGLINGVIVYVRSAASATVGPISGKIVLASAGVASKNVAVDGVVNALPTVNSPGNQVYNNGEVTTAVSFTGTGNIFNWVNNTPAIGLAAGGTGDIAPFTAVNTGSTPLKATITVTPEIKKYGYVTNANDNTVSVIDINTNKVVSTIHVDGNPVRVTISPDGSKVYTTNESADNVSVINTSTNSVINTIPVGGVPSGTTISSDGSQLYVVNIYDNNISVINTASSSVVKTIPTGLGPLDAVLSNDGKLLYVTNNSENNVWAINTANGSLVANIPVGGRPEGITISRDGNWVYVSNYQDATISVINTATNKVISTLLVSGNPTATGVSPDGKLLYSIGDFDDKIVVIDIASKQIVKTITVGTTVWGVSLNPDGSLLYVTSTGDNTVLVINTATNAVLTRIPVGAAPSSFGTIAIPGAGCPGIPITFTITVNARLPAITHSAVTGTITACAGLPSASPNIQQFTVSGSGLSGDVTATAPIGFEVSLSATSGFSNSVILTGASGSVTNVIVYVRSADYAIGSVSGDVELSTPGLPSKAVPVSGFVNALPTTNAVANQTKQAGEASDAINFTGTGDSYTWTNDKPEIGLLANGSGDIVSFTTKNAGSSPIVATITVTPSAASSSCGGKPVTFTITVTQSLPAVISNTIPPNGVNTVYGTPSAATSFTISGTNMREGIKVTPPTGVEVSTDNINFSNTITVGAAGTIAQTTIYVRLAKTTPAGSYQGPIDLTSTGASTVSLDLPVSVVSPAPLTITAANKNKDYGTLLTGASGLTDFTISGLQNFETAGTVTIAYGNGAAANSPVNSYPGSVSPSALTGGTFAPKNYTSTYINGDITIYKVPLTIAADNKIKTYKDPNLILTVTYSGFVNNESPAQLTSLPVVSTTADERSVPGKYVILVSGATSPSYNIVLVNGVFTVLGINMPLKIPNTFTPNGDGINDTWNIVNIDSYPDCTVNIYNRWGQNIFSSIGYGKSWDGRYKGTLLPVNTYYYIIDLKNENKPYSGSITIIR